MAELLLMTDRAVYFAKGDALLVIHVLPSRSAPALTGIIDEILLRRKIVIL